MGVPEEIRKVERPVNTIVYKVKEGTYGVRERAGLKYGPDGKPRPVNGKVVGHIVNGKYVPLVADMSRIPMLLSYGSSALLKAFSDDIYDDLLSVYPIEAAKTIMAMASLKVIRPSIRCGRYSSEYERTYVSVYYPECALSRNRISSSVSSVGKDSGKREMFFQKRISRIPGNHLIAIDGTLKQDSSTVNSLSGFSYKSRIKRIKDISVIYAYDIETGEPLCSSVFPGNNIDAVSYRQFVVQNSIDKGIIVTDKGFPPSEIADIIKEKKGLHFMTPLRRNEKKISANNRYAYEEIVEGIGGGSPVQEGQDERWEFSLFFSGCLRNGKGGARLCQARSKKKGFQPGKIPGEKGGGGNNHIGVGRRHDGPRGLSLLCGEVEDRARVPCLQE